MEKYYLGLDGGSTYLKAALMKDKKVVGTVVYPTGIDNNGVAKKIVAALCKKYGISRTDIGYIMATGYSRKILEVADDDISEITAHAYGVRVTAPKEYRPGMVIDIGGQDSKIIYLDANYNVKNFTMNDKCAAGTGKFMEVIAQILETTIDQVGALSLESTSPCDINSTCVVFAQSEVISLVARKVDRRDILAGMHLSMAKRIIKMMKKSEKGGDILMTGGGALNTGISLAKSGQIKTIGVSNHNLMEIKRANEILAAEGLKISAVQNHYSLLHRSSERAGILDYCKENGITFYSYMVLEQGALTGRYSEENPFPEGTGRAEAYNPHLKELTALIDELKIIGTRFDASPAQVATAWAIAKGTLPIIGVTKVRQVEEAAKAAQIVMTADEISRLERLGDETGVHTLREWEKEM